MVTCEVVPHYTPAACTVASAAATAVHVCEDPACLVPPAWDGLAAETQCQATEHEMTQQCRTCDVYWTAHLLTWLQMSPFRSADGSALHQRMTKAHYCFQTSFAAFLPHLMEM